MKFKLIFLVTFLAFLFNSFTPSPLSFTRNKKASKSFIVGFYNVENLFDTLDDPHKNDNQFLPKSKKKWNADRYFKKLNDLEKVIYSIDTNNLPVIFGLAEAENKQVVEDLINTGHLKNHYQVIHKESPDFRGIDVAVIYQPEKFNLIHQQWIRFQLPGKTRPSTRDIVYIKGTIIKKDTLHFFFCHWPSRYGGTEKTIPLRAKAAKELKLRVDSLLALNKNAKIIIMGDLNDHPNDASVVDVLKAKRVAEKSKLVNLMWQYFDKNEGSYFYKGNWGVLDHIIVARGVLEAKKGLKTRESQAKIHKQDFFLYTNKKGITSPARTYGGSNYYGGYSDHLPIYLRLSKK